MITPVMQRYLTETYRLQERTSPVSLTLLAEHMDVSLQAVSRMVRHLRDKNLLVHAPYQGIQLTESGRKIALQAIRRHRLIEVFLVDTMRFTWDVVHELSDVLEPGINQVLEDRIDELTGHPTSCPHGEPIPTRDGVMPPRHDASLTALEPGFRGAISRIRTEDSDKLRYLGELGLVPGVQLDLISRAPFNGPLRIRANGQEQVLGTELAVTIWVLI